MSRSTPKSAVLFENVYQGSEPQSLSDYLKTAAGISGRSLRKYFFRGLIFVNSRKAHSSARIKRGDAVKVLEAREQQTLVPEAMPLDIVFENDGVLIVNKPPRIAVHPVKGITAGTLSHGVAAYFEKTGLLAKVRPVNRLDFGTSGLIIFAKNARTQDELSALIQNRAVHRLYYAVVQGIPELKRGTIDLPIGENNGKRFISEHGQPAETHYRVIEPLNGSCLMELSLMTGRTHQIRVHLKHLGHPILGDRQYGVESPFIQRPALHAGKLVFAASGFNIPDLEAPFPEDFLSLLNRLRTRPPV